MITVTETELTEVVAPTPFTVTLDPNGGTVSSTTLTVWDDTKTTLPTPTRTGYTFGGWYNGDTLVTKKAAVYITGDCTLTAKWTANTYSDLGRLESKTDRNTIHVPNTPDKPQYENNSKKQKRLLQNFLQQSLYGFV